jgi:hypothetical protein
VDQRHIAAGHQLGDAADVPGGDNIRAGFCDVGELAVAQPAGDFRLQQIVGAGRTAADMPFRDLYGLEPGRGQQCLRYTMQLLPMLHRARRMIGDAQSLRGIFGRRRAQSELTYDFRHIAR